LAAGEDAIINEILHQKKNDNIRLVKWENESDFEKKFEQILQEELKLTSFNDNGAFNTSLGSEDGKYFNSTQDANYFENEPAVNGIECWQVLSPVREKTFGVKAINRKIHKSFRQNTISYCHKYSTTNFPKPMGVDEIVYGDKIINLSNQHRGGSWKPVRPEGGMDYIANGEIGIVVGQFKRSATAFKGRPKWMEVEFASQK
jgi:ATP-dependent exoDNAse (exonuclease V) alpha subunit